MPKDIFISHSSKDKPIIDKFIDLILENGLGINVNNIFCTSTAGTKIKPGKDWRKEIKDNLLTSKVVILIITSNYKESEVCLNEMGVAWAIHKMVLTMVLHPISNKTAGIIDIKQIENLNDEEGLDRIKDVIEDNIETSSKSDRWTSKKREFLKYLDKYTKQHPFFIPISRIEFDKLIKEKGELKQEIDKLLEEKENLKDYISDLKDLKDKKEVMKLNKKFDKTTSIENFKILAIDINKELVKFDPIILGVIYDSFERKNLGITGEGYESQIKAALAQNHIIADDQLEADWDSTKKMKNLYKKLREMKNLIYNADDSSLSDWFEENYDTEFDFSNINFWESVFKISIRID